MDQLIDVTGRRGMLSLQATRHTRLSRIAACSVALTLTLSPFANALPRTWVGGDGTWSDGAGNNAFWSPADEPDTDDEAIFNTAHGVLLGTNNTIQALTLSGGVDLETAGFDLVVAQLISISGAGTSLLIDTDQSNVSSGGASITGSGVLRLSGGSLTAGLSAGTALVATDATSSIAGFGQLVFIDAPASATTVLNNNGTLRATRAPANIFAAPLSGTLSIASGSVNARLDLDGSAGTGQLVVDRNQTMQINGRLTDAFSGTIVLRHGSLLSMSDAWTIDSGTVNVETGFVDNALPMPDVPADVATIAGAALTMTGGTLNNLNSDGTLRLAATLAMSGGQIVNHGHLIFDADANLSGSASIVRPNGVNDITVEANRVVAINVPNFDLDGGGLLGNVVTVQPNAFLSINTTDYDPDTVINRFDSVITLNNGNMLVTSADATFVMDGTLNLVAVGNGVGPTWSGEPMAIGDDSGSQDAIVDVTGTAGGVAQIEAPTTIRSDARITIADGVRLAFTHDVMFNSVNGLNNAVITGPGDIHFNRNIAVNESTTLSFSGGTIDLDGTDTFGDEVLVSAPLNLFAQSIATYGKARPDSNQAYILVDNVGPESGQLNVTLDDPQASWGISNDGWLILLADSTPETLLSGATLAVDGRLTAIGHARSNARLLLGDPAAVDIDAATSTLRLNGGNNTDKPNRIDGALILGNGMLAADSGRALHGFGNIWVGIDFDGDSDLLADDGTLSLSGPVVDARFIGTADADGVFEVTSAWSSGGVALVLLNGGELAGSTLTIANLQGVQGHGSISAPVINNALISANSGVSLVVQTAGNNNDWDGATNTGKLIAVGARTLDLRDDATFSFQGTVRAASGGRVLANGFELRMAVGSTLQLSGGTFESTVSTDFAGLITTEASPNESVIKIPNNSFLDVESTAVVTLNSNLRLLNNNILIRAGSTFSGNSALIIDSASAAVFYADSDVNVQVVNEGTVRPGGFNVAGRADVRDYEQADGAWLIVDLAGATMSQYDRLIVEGLADLGGHLELKRLGFYDPQSLVPHTILTGSTRTGVFATVTGNEVSPTKFLAVTYTPTSVVVTAAVPGDTDLDGDVDFADLLTLAQNYDAPGQKTWSLGDFTGNGTTAFGDLLLLAQNFGLGSMQADANPAHFGTEWTRARSLVPEPTTTLVGLGMLTLMTQRARTCLGRSAHIG